MSEIEELKKIIKDLEEQLSTANSSRREKINEMSSEVVDSNPYR